MSGGTCASLRDDIQWAVHREVMFVHENIRVMSINWSRKSPYTQSTQRNE